MKIVFAAELNVHDSSAPWSIRKSKLVYDLVSQHRDSQVVMAGPISRELLVRVHDPAYVGDVLEGRKPDGFGNRDRLNLPAILAANGCMVEAARIAVRQPGEPVFTPVSGFHHAGMAVGGGFCTFNGLLAAVAGLPEPRPYRVLIVDGDGHHGDGTEEILLRNPAFRGVRQITSTAAWNWRVVIRETLAQYPWGLVLYQAGADAHKADPFGVGYLDDDEFEERDAMVIETCARRGLPLVVNLAGGYNGGKTLDLHCATATTARVWARRAAAERGVPPSVLSEV